MYSGSIDIPLSAIPPIPARAEMLLAVDWSGWYWSDVENGHHLLYRDQGQSGGNYRLFANEDNLIQFIDEKGGLYEYESVANDMPEPDDNHNGSVSEMEQE